MRLPDPKALAVKTVSEPAAVARELMDLKLPREALWTTLALLAVVHALYFMLTEFLAPSPFYDSIGSPLHYFVLAGATMLLTVVALHGVGRILGGTGSLDNMLVLIVWLQMLNLFAQTVIIFVGLLFPGLALILYIGTGFLGLYIMLHFINQAHDLNSFPHAIMVLLGMVVVVLIGAIIVQVVLFGPQGGSINNV